MNTSCSKKRTHPPQSASRLNTSALLGLSPDALAVAKAKRACLRSAARQAVEGTKTHTNRGPNSRPSNTTWPLSWANATKSPNSSSRRKCYTGGCADDKSHIHQGFCAGFGVGADKSAQAVYRGPHIRSSYFVTLWFTLQEVAAATGRAHSTVRRRLDLGGFPNARRDPDWPGPPNKGPWQIPDSDLEQAGLRITSVQSWADEPGVLRYKISILEERIISLEKNLAAAAAVAAERKDHIERLIEVIAAGRGDL